MHEFDLASDAWDFVVSVASFDCSDRFHSH